MNLFLDYDFERSFPFVVLDYVYDATTAPLHMHDYLEIVLCTEGEGRFLFPDREVAVREGDVLFINRFYNHVAVSAQGERPVRFLLVLFLPELVDSVWLTHRDKAALEQFWNDMGENILRVQRDAPCLPALRAMIRDIDAAWRQRGDAHQMAIDGQLKLLLVAALRYYAALKPNVPAVDYTMRARFQGVLRHIQDHCADRLSVGELGAMVHLSDSQFRHNFKLATNMSFQKYLASVRLAKAIELLVSTELPVAEVAAAAGFSNLNNFYRLFAAKTAMSPADYRRRNKGIFLPRDR